MTTCAQPIVAAGETDSVCPQHEAVRVFGPFAPFGATWRRLTHWNFGANREPERLHSLRFEVLSSLTEGNGLAPNENTLERIASQGLIRIRYFASRVSGRQEFDFFTDLGGIDIYASHVKVELWAPDTIEVAKGQVVDQGASLGVLDASIAPGPSRVGAPLRPVGTLTTYAVAGTVERIPPRAQRYSVLGGQLPEFLVGATPVATAAESQGLVGGVTHYRMPTNAVVVWEVAP